MKKITIIILCLLLCGHAMAQIQITPVGTITTCGGPVTLSTDSYTPNVVPGLADDVYSGPIDIGFPFIFYGTSYTKFVISPNGYITFDLGKTGFAEYRLANFIPLSQRGIPNNAAATKSICGLYTDILLPRGGTLTYGVAGVAPNRKMVVEFCHVFMFDAARCGTQWATFQMILYEGSNNIEIHIGHRDNCGGWNSGYGIVGIENDLGTGDWPPGRNVPTIFDVHAFEAYRYTPVGGGYSRVNIPYAPIPGNTNIEWYQGSTYLTTGSSITVSPASTTTYTAKVIGCDGITAMANKTVYLVPPITPDPIMGDPTLCVNETKVYTDAATGGVWSGTDAVIDVNPTTGEVKGLTPGTGIITYTTTNLPCPAVSVYKTVTVRPSPVLHPTYSPRPLCSGDPYNVFANANDGLSAGGGCAGCSFDWTWPGGGYASTTGDPLSRPGNITDCNISVPYTVKVTSSIGCSTTEMIPADIYAHANAGTISGPSVACGTDVITLSETGSNANCLPSSWGITRIHSIGGGTGTFGITLTPDPTDNSKATLTCGDVPCITIVDIQFKVYSDSCGDDTANFRVVIKPKPKFVSATVISCNPICPGNPISVEICGSPGAWVHYIYTWPGCTPVADSILMPSGGCGSTVCATVVVPAPTGPCPVNTGMFIFDMGLMELNHCTTLIGSSRTVQIEYPWANIELVGPSPCLGQPYTLKITGTPGARVWLFPEYMPYDGTLYPPFVDLPMSGTDRGIAYISGLIIPPPAVGGSSYGKNTFCIRQVDADSSCGGCSVHTAETYESVFSHPLPCLNVIALEIPYVTLTTSHPICEDKPFTLYGSYYPLGGGPVTTHDLMWDGWTMGHYIGWHSAPTDLTQTIMPSLPAGVYTYHLTATGDNGCTNSTSLTVTVNPNPPAIVEVTGPSPICEGGMLLLHELAVGGTWSSGSPTLADIASSWETTLSSWAQVHGIHHGTSVITYTAATGCFATRDVVVNPDPVITGDLFMCSLGLSSPLYPNITGGTWMSDAPGVVYVDPATGWVTSMAVGSANITYTLPSHCFGTIHITVLDGMTPITGYTFGCGTGSTINLSNITPGGTWSSSDPSVATVNSAGVVTFTGTGTATIYYCLNPQYGSTMYPADLFIGCCAELEVKNIIPVVHCYAIQRSAYWWDLGFVIDGLTPSDNITFYYNANVIQPGTTPCTPGPGPGLTPEVYGPVTGTGGTTTFSLPTYSTLYTGSPCYFSAINLDSIVLDGCTWRIPCTAMISRPGHTAETGTAAVTEQADIRIIPNPNNGSFTISGYIGHDETATKARIQVTDMLGKILLSDEAVVDKDGINKTILLSDNIANGVYLIKVNTGSQDHVIHFVLHR